MRVVSVGPVMLFSVKPEPNEEYSVHVAAVVDASWQDMIAVSWLSTEPEYLNVLGPSAKVKGRGPEIRQSSGLEQKTVYVVAVRSLVMTLPTKPSQFSVRYPGT